MKKILFLFISILLVFSMIGCKAIRKDEAFDTENVEEEDIDYKIEKIVLSKGFQSLSPNVEVLKKGSSLQLMASPGLLDSSGVAIDKITKSGKEINIYITNRTDEVQKKLSTPQILVEIDDPLIKNLDKIHFNIISENYEPITLKLDKNQILNKIYSDFKIEPTSLPSVDLNKTKDSFVWDISFNNVLTTDSSNFSLVNLDVSIDANTGKIIKSIKDDISTYVDDGVLFDFISDKFLLYKRHHIEEGEYDSLWIYNIETGEKNNIYTSKYKIHSALFNPDGGNLSFIETNGDNSDIYISKLENKTAYKITPANNLNSKLMRWVDNKFYFMDVNKSKSILFEYDIDKNESITKLYLDKAVESFDISNDELLFVEYDKDLTNQNIYLTKDGSKLNQIGSGFQATFLSDNSIAYLQNIEKEDKDTFQIYSKEGQTEHKDSEYSITNYLKLDDDNVLLYKKNSCNNDYILAKYNIKNKDISQIANINSDTMFYNSKKARAYLNLTPPPDKKKQSIIYSIDLNKLNIMDK